MELKREFVLREIAGDTLLIPTGRTALDLNGMLTLNELGAEIWRLLPQAENDGEYEVEEDVLRADVAEFLGKLRALGILA